MLVIPYLLLFAHPFPALFTMTNAEKSQMVNDPLGNHKSPKTIIAGLNSQGTDHKPSSSSMKPPQGTVQRSIRDTSHRATQNPIKVLISDTCIKQDTQGDSGSSAQYQGKELDLDPGSPLVLTHRISLVPGACDGGCDADYEALRGRLDKLEREVSTLREKCGDAEGGCCKRGTGVVCNECPNDCSDQGRCVGGKCVCFPGFTGPDCSSPTCPSNCNRGKCVNGQCVCNPGFLGPDCSEKACPNNCNNRGRCVNGKCVCDSGFTGLDCSEKACLNNCNNRGQCVNGKCVCDSGFTGLDCSEKACPNNCNNRGRCVNGKCMCDSGFTGLDCSEKACPNNCNNRGRCVNGKCMCDSGFTGLDCSEKACPNSCNNRGRCLNGKCVCDSGFIGLDCSEKACPNNCNNRGRCVNGKCVCDSGITGLDCSEMACPNNCNNRGRCLNGKCVCDSGFTGLDCSEKACPNNCNNRGRCLNGKCVCDSGFTGLECSEKACPGNCSSRGRCMKGKCLCRRGFTGPDCSQCEAGFTGSDCSTALSAVTQLRTRDISESAVTVSWTPPSIQYDMYHVTFTSKKEGDQKVTATVASHLSSFTQTGLAAGQEYTVTVRGEKDGTMGQESNVVFTTLISGPKNLHVVKTTTTTAVVQWEPPQGDIDRYHLSVSPSQTDREGTGASSKNRTLPPDRNSAHIESLEAGRLYNISLVAQKGRSHSQPATVQVTPGPEPPSDLTFSNVTDSSFSVSWKKPTSPVTGFKVTYIHTQDGEPISLSLKSHQTTVRLSALSPGSFYEVSVISTLDMDESDPVKGLAVTAPDPPTDLRAINITDSKALLLWRPALASVDQYIIVYGPEKGSDVTLTVTGNTAEQQLRDLKGSTVYMVTVSSKLDEQHSRAVNTRFTTAGAGGGGEGPQDLKASQVTPRSAVLSWKAPTTVVSSYKLTYQTAGQETKQVILDGSVTQYKLRKLSPASRYIARLQVERQGQYTAAVSTDFTTGTLRFPFPTDCSQELLNGIPDSGETEIFPNGNRGPSALVYCDMETEGGGWTVIQRRMDGTTNFFRRWKEYSAGFGNMSGEFWIGNELLHNLTQMMPMTMRVDLRSESESAYARYSSFSIDSARRHYAIKVSGYSGTAGDSMKYHNGRPFSTRDRDPYPFITRCAMSYRGGWWYKNCHEANLNGLYDTHTNHQGVIWTEWKGKDFSIPFTEMKIRPTSFTPPPQP
ncbi:tenascin-R-like isoform X2 [Paramormyrops kingsleyae]|uniref:tenascin-R-like isoform X2 n=1 Tax=Paramormyrops kingsleyae TaxID=1676925 RepID=UPI003B96E0BA